MQKQQRPRLTLDAELFEQPDHELDELVTTFRQNNISIGPDYLRFDGATISRNQLLPDCVELHELLGKGAFSKVHRATWKQTASDSSNIDVIVAVKTFSIDMASHSDMLVKELKALVSLQQSLQQTSPSLIQLHGAFLQHEQVAMIVEYMDGGSLEDYISGRTSSVPHDMIAGVAFQTLDGLSALHAHKILHRDLKPANILLDASKGVVKLADFGLASDVSSSCLNTTLLGTSKFMAPERLRGRAYGRSSDLWSFGLCLVQCLTLEAPWEDCRSLVELLVTVEETSTKSIIPANAESGLAEMLSACLQQHPAKRIPASILMKSPWLLENYKISDHASAADLVRLHLAGKSKGKGNE
ncbi:hypothetical protein MPSEU_000965500 [Mayamaea pseudoterrestris]|nr:hypothetical protein MPSEU_000964800 [Mayamaea pseudoterrestris]GKZ00121.1 hypothetical protein MPSEU_000965500 [Mayamaea pseudoterrestris]